MKIIELILRFQVIRHNTQHVRDRARTRASSRFSLIVSLKFEFQLISRVFLRIGRLASIQLLLWPGWTFTCRFVRQKLVQHSRIQTHLLELDDDILDELFETAVLDG